MHSTEQALANKLIAACEALLKNANRCEAALVQSALDLAKDHYSTEKAGKDD